MNYRVKPVRIKRVEILLFLMICFCLGSCRTTSDHPREVLDRLHMQALKSSPRKKSPLTKAYF